MFQMYSKNFNDSIWIFFAAWNEKKYLFIILNIFHGKNIIVILYIYIYVFFIDKIYIIEFFYIQIKNTKYFNIFLRLELQ